MKKLDTDDPESEYEKGNAIMLWYIYDIIHANCFSLSLFFSLSFSLSVSLSLSLFLFLLLSLSLPFSQAGVAGVYFAYYFST